jgi:glucokinase
MYLGIEIGGTKLQLGLGAGDGHIVALWRGTVNPAEGGEGIRKQIERAVPELLAKANLDRGALRGAGIGFGGPTDDATRTVIKSHQIAGWDGFPLADWVSDLVGVPAVLCNDADVAGLGEALFGAGKGLSPVFYITIGSGIGGGLIIDGQIYRGVGRGAAEIGHLLVPDCRRDCESWYDAKSFIGLEEVASGWGIGHYFSSGPVWIEDTEGGDRAYEESELNQRPRRDISAREVGELVARGDEWARTSLERVWMSLAHALSQTITLLCPARIVIGGGVSLMGDVLFVPLRRFVSEMAFEPFRGIADIVPAALGEEVVVHGALALARQKLSS